jgi:hypothetical protein
MAMPRAASMASFSRSAWPVSAEYRSCRRPGSQLIAKARKPPNRGVAAVVFCRRGRCRLRCRG